MSEALRSYLAELAGAARPGQLLDLRWASPGGAMCQRFINAGQIELAVSLLTAHAARADVYLGVALRDRRAGGKAAISGSHLVFVERDRAGAERDALLERSPPSIEIASGTPGHRHLYWRLDSSAAAEEVEIANRRLALALDGDPHSVDVARILRPPGTLNHKTSPPRAVRLLALRTEARYTLTQLLDGLPPDPRPPRRATSPNGRASDGELDRRLRAIATERYVFALTGREPDRAGNVLCPFHAETRPSLHLYPDGGFYCFGCGRGGSIIDFAAALWDSGTRGGEFLALRARLAERFGLRPRAGR